MTEPDIEKYCAVMEEIKLRTNVVRFLLSGQGSVMYAASTLESSCLQLRKILELIAFGSLVANKEVYSSAYRGFAKHWNASDLLKLVEKINPHFYPNPIVEVPSDWPDIKRELKRRNSDYLTKEEFADVYGRCGVMMHASNPYGAAIDYNFYNKSLPIWQTRIVNLLSTHQMRLVGDPGFYLVHMKERGDNKVHAYKFAPPNPAR